MMKQVYKEIVIQPTKRAMAAWGWVYADSGDDIIRQSIFKSLGSFNITGIALVGLVKHRIEVEFRKVCELPPMSQPDFKD